MNKRWLTLAEAASELGEDPEGLRQAMEVGELGNLPALVYSGAGRFPAQIGTTRQLRPEGDDEGDITAQRISGEPSSIWWWLKGCFRLEATSMRMAARERTLYQCCVAPRSWWDRVDIPKYKNLDPDLVFILRHPGSKDRDHPDMTEDLDPIYSFDNLRFSAVDIAAFKSGSSPFAGIGSGATPARESPGVDEKWPWGAHETQAIRYLEAAAKKWWSHYDPLDPTTAHTNDEVADWLIKEHGVSGRLANSIASILRVDGLKSGPRK